MSFIYVQAKHSGTNIQAVNKALRTAPGYPVKGVKNLKVPSIRLCPACAALCEVNRAEEHCKHFECQECKTWFCLNCLQIRTSGWPANCGNAFDPCKVPPAPRQQYKP